METSFMSLLRLEKMADPGQHLSQRVQYRTKPAPYYSPAPGGRRDAARDTEEGAIIRGPKRRMRYNASPNSPTDRARAGVLGENRNTNVDTSGPIRVLLADDHTMFRQGLAAILASHGGLEVVAEVPNDAFALRLARELSPDVVIMQVQMPFQRAVATLQAMRAFTHPPMVVICTMLESPRYVRALTGVGASAYVIKTSSAEHLVAGVRAAVLDPEAKNVVVGMPLEMLQESPDGVDDVLSARELEILLLAARGLSNQQIAASANLAEGTVKRHLANIYQKLGVSSRTEASREALLREWITIEEVTDDLDDLEGIEGGPQGDR
jgi:DNA-binding NarL/FixJ family response regulator